MKKVTLIVLTLGGGSAAFAALGDVVGSFRIPNVYLCGGLARSGDYLYSNHATDNKIYKVDPYTGSVYTSYNSPIIVRPMTANRGLAYQAGGYLWISKIYFQPWTTYKLDADTGSILASYLSPTGECTGSAPRCTGDGGVGTNAIFLSDWTADLIFVMSTAGSVQGSFHLDPTVSMYDIAYDWRNKLIWGAMNEVNFNEVWLHGCDTTGSILASFELSIRDCYGITYYGQYLWAGTTDGWIYRVHCPKLNIGVRPASFGKVKALFR